MNNHDNGHASRVLLLALTLALVLAGGWLAASSAYAGSWMEVSCVNPSQSAAPSEGWTSFAGGAATGRTTARAAGRAARCMRSSARTPPSVSARHETLQYTPPAGSTLIGGSVDVSFYADGGGYDASGTAVAYTPEYAYNGVQRLLPVRARPGTVRERHRRLRGGARDSRAAAAESLYLSAGCGGAAGDACDEGGSEGAWSLVRLWWANLLLSNEATPSAAGSAGRC